MAISMCFIPEGDGPAGNDFPRCSIRRRRELGRSARPDGCSRPLSGQMSG
jgi:hypothetical protein